MALSRRSLLAGSTLAGAALTVGGDLWCPAPALADEKSLTPVGFGPASLTSAVRGAAVIGDSVFIASRFNTPEQKLRLAEFDATTGATRAVDDLDIPSSGGNKMTADDRYVYIGPAGSAHVWRFDPRTKELLAWAKPGTSTTWSYEMVVDGGYLYTGTYPDCTVRRIRLSDATIETYGRVSTSQYATALDVDDEYVYAGSAAPGALLLWPKAGGTPVDLTAHLSDSPVGILDLAVRDKVIHVASGRQLISFRADGSERVSREIPAEDRYIDQVAVGHDGKVYALARLTSNVYEVTGTGLEKVGQPIQDVENALLAPQADGSLIGVSGLGHIWRMAPGGTPTVWHSATRGFGYPEVVQSMLLHSRGTVWVAGHYAMTVHRPERGISVRFDINGEPKSLAEGARGTVYAGLYPSTQIVAIGPDRHDITVVGTLGHEQLRARRIHVDSRRNQLLVASSPATTKHTGALTFVDLATNRFDVHREYLPEQSVMDVAVSGRTAYIVGDTYGEVTPGPLRPTAQVAAVDIVTRELLWREEIKPDWASYESIHVVGNLLYAMARRPRGAWFAYDLTTRTIVMEGDLGGYGQFNGLDGRVFSWVHWTNDICELPTSPGGEPTTLYDNVARGWYNNPMFNFTPNGKATWGMHGTDLALFPLPKTG
ncbi:twin-arginine translocation signal domain-containing protein [Streptomyces sp. NPDC057565]|uniref:twin-arginine translocation signal domain-containing protein n=1 Tax=Streptomyces sp. NPDC057565 TaxID=3346169 RepID=UPI00369C2D86